MIPETQPDYPVDGSVHEFPLMLEGACKHYADLVLQNRQHWQRRGFFNTLGASAYLEPLNEYAGIANATNPGLHKSYNGLYSTIYSYLSALLKQPIADHPAGIGLMGFHIFCVGAGSIRGHVHTDEPYLQLDWPMEFKWPFSFTLPLELPECGGGMDVWDQLTESQVQTYEERGLLPEHQHIAYKIGHLYLHSGSMYHRIANPGKIHAGEYRISLQGHGVYTDKGLILYF